MPSSAWIAWRHASHDVTCLCHPSLLIQVRQIRARQRPRALPSRLREHLLSLLVRAVCFVSARSRPAWAL